MADLRHAPGLGGFHPSTCFPIGFEHLWDGSTGFEPASFNARGWRGAILISAAVIVAGCATVARGINVGLRTRLYFGDEEAANAERPVLKRIEHPSRRNTLIAPRSEEDGLPVYTFDVHLQGEGETVFFDV